MKSSYSIFILLLMHLFSSALCAEEQYMIDEWMRKAHSLEMVNPKQAAYYALKVIDSYPENKVNDTRARAMLLYASTQRLLGNFDLSIKMCYNALDYLTPGNHEVRGKLYNAIGGLYSSFFDFSKAIEFNEKAISVFKSENDSSSLAICYNNRGVIHSFKHEYTLAEQFLQQSLSINRALNLPNQIAGNLNNLCLYEGDFKEKIGMIQEAIAINKGLNHQWCLSENYNNMGRQYYFNKQYNKALNILETSYAIATDIDAKELMCDNYEYKTWIYSEMGDYKSAYTYLDKLNKLKDELQNSNKLRNIEQEVLQNQYIKQKHKTAEEAKLYQIELLKRNFYIVVIALVLLLVVSLFIYMWYKRKKNMELLITQHKLESAEIEMNELKMRQNELELTRAQEELQRNQQDITNFALYLNSRNDLLEKIREMVRQGYKMSGNDLSLHLKKINSLISQYQNSDKNTSALVMHIEEKNKEFLTTLLERHPGLTNGEKYLATLLRVNLSTKEISVLTGTTPQTINMNRYRLRKSLNLSTDDNLVEYLQQI